MIATMDPPSTAGTVRLAKLRALVRTGRPRQWIKNLLVAAAPLAAGRLLDLGVARTVGLAFVAFCVTSAGIYLVNDIRDAPLDRAHPTKRRRPIAAGDLPVRLAAVTAALLLPAGIGLGFLVARGLGTVITLYVVISLAYSFLLKDQPVIDLTVIAAGFVLRAMAGGLATGIPLSNWFLLVTSFGSLFVAAGKRYSEAERVGNGGASDTRASLARYTVSYLRFVWGTTAGVTLTGYALWAFEMSRTTGRIWPAVSMVPLVLGLLRYAMDIDAGTAEAPEEIVLRDRVLQVIVVSWLILLALGVA
jgi:decaprenyl-phosphate phosphoribosyltransferase